MNVVKITQWLQKGWSRFKNLKIHFLPTAPAAASVFPSDAERLGLSSLYVIKAKKKIKSEKRTAKAFCLRVASGGSRGMED